MLESAEKLNRPIRSEAELNLYTDVHSKVDDLVKAIKALQVQERQPWHKVISQIGEATEPMRNRLERISDILRRHITDWRAKWVAGQQREAERLEVKAAEKEAEAKYSDNPQKKRTAKLEAKQLKAEAKALKPIPAKGIDTEKYYTAKITNRQQAALLPQEAIDMEPNDNWFNREVKARIKNGERFNERMFRGIELSEQVKVRFHR